METNASGATVSAEFILDFDGVVNGDAYLVEVVFR